MTEHSRIIEEMHETIQGLHAGGLIDEQRMQEHEAFYRANQVSQWREALNVRDEDLPAICLRGGRTKEGLTQKQLSEITGIPRCRISAMENGKRPIDKKMARILATALKLDARRFLSV